MMLQFELTNLSILKVEIFSPSLSSDWLYLTLSGFFSLLFLCIYILHDGHFTIENAFYTTHPD